MECVIHMGLRVTKAWTGGYPWHYTVFLMLRIASRGSPSSVLGSGHDTLHTLNQHQPNQALAYAVQIQVGYPAAPL